MGIQVILEPLKKYDVTISIEAAASLDVLIVDKLYVDNMETGSACLNYLKKHDIGRISALALDKTERYLNDVTKNFKAPESAPRLVDLYLNVLERKLHADEERLGQINEKRGESEGAIVTCKW